MTSLTWVKKGGIGLLLLCKNTVSTLSKDFASEKVSQLLYHAFFLYYSG